MNRRSIFIIQGCHSLSGEDVNEKINSTLVYSVKATATLVAWFCPKGNNPPTNTSKDQINTLYLVFCK